MFSPTIKLRPKHHTNIGPAKGGLVYETVTAAHIVKNALIGVRLEAQTRIRLTNPSQPSQQQYQLDFYVARPKTMWPAANFSLSFSLAAPIIDTK